jgi:diacylglycerol kinase (ATP)
LLDEQRRARATVRVIETRSHDELDDAARDIARTDPSAAVVFAGGDGSYMAGVTALHRAFGKAKLPPIAFAPGGTVSTVAKNWGLRGNPVGYSRRLLDAIVLGTARSTRRPTLRIRATGLRSVVGPDPRNAGRATSHARDTEPTTHVGFILGAGLVARFFEIYEARGAGGNATAARIVARIFAGSFVGSPFARSVLDPSRCTIEVDGAPASFDRVSLLCASVVRDLGLGMRLLYRAGEELDRFHIVATPLEAKKLGPQMPLVLAARPLLGERIDALAEKLALRFPEGRGVYVLDGELFRADILEVTAGPPLDVLTPP